MKFRFALASLLLAGVMLLSACNSGDAPDGADTGSSAAEDTSADVPAADVLLTGENAPEYAIIRGDNAGQSEIDAAIFLRKYLEKCGVKTKIITDWEKNPVSDYEFVVGNTLRADTDEGIDIEPVDVGEEGWFVKVSGSRVYMSGGSAATIQTAVEHFLTEFFGYAGDPETAAAAGEVKIAGDYEHIVRQQYPITAVLVDGRDLREYKITWDTAMGGYYGEPSAENIQSKIYKSTGIWLDIVEDGETWDGPTVLLSGEAADKEGYFTMAVQDGDLVLTTAVKGGIDRGFSKYYNDSIRDAEGEISMDKNFKYEEDIGSFVLYSEFGAKGDGRTNDIKAIIAAHEYANANGLEVRGDQGATYYISAADAGAVVRTNVDWTGCSFVIDDSGVGLDKRGVAIFTASATKASYSLTDQIKTVAKGQEKLDITLPEDSIIVLTEAGTKRYIREGKNQNSGSDQTDIIVVDKNGNIDMAAPVIWDYTNVTSAKVIPMDEETLTLRGGTFTTIANNQAPSSSYYTRGIRINRSNVVVEDLVHYVTGEGEQGSPYSGILVIQDCANITVRDCTFTAHKTYTNIKTTGAVSQGTYDISPSRVVNLTFENCDQTTDILDTKYWGIMGSNFCKNIVVRDCTFSRFDAHQGVANVTIIGSTLGHQCLNAIGCGTLRVEDSTLYGSSFINLRSDYGSTWEGDVIIKDCTWIPNKGNTLTGNYAIFGGSYSGFHDFGYECYMPANITIENLHIDDSKAAASYPGVFLFGNITSAYTSEAYEKKVEAQGYPYHITETVTISGFTSESGKKWNLSPNKFMFRSVVINDLDAK